MLCDRTVMPEDLLSHRPGCSFCKGHAPIDDLPVMLARYERAWVIFALAQHCGVKNRAAKALGITRTGLVEKLKRMGITVRITDDKPDISVGNFYGFM